VSGDRLAGRAAAGLHLAAAPVFAALAVLTSGGVDMLCMHGASPLQSMATMYWLMSAVHSAPWLRLLSRILTVEKTSPMGW